MDIPQAWCRLLQLNKKIYWIVTKLTFINFLDRIINIPYNFKQCQSHCVIWNLVKCVPVVWGNTHRILWAWSRTFMGCILTLENNVLITNNHTITFSDMQFNFQLNIEWLLCAKRLIMMDESKSWALLWTWCLKTQEYSDIIDEF